MIEYLVGPVVAVLISMKFTDYKVKELSKKVEEVSKTCDARVTEVNQQTSKALIGTLTPVAKAIKQLNEQVGIE